MSSIPKIRRYNSRAKTAITFNEQFTGVALDTAKWNYRLPWDGWNNGVNGEIQSYRTGTNNIAVGSNKLTITAKYETVTEGDGDYNYTSGMINTRGKFSQLYGIFETRFRFQDTDGAWPAVWLLQQDDTTFPWPPELDIVEASGLNPTQIQVNSHYLDASGSYQQDYHLATMSYGLSSWCTATMDWTASYIKYYLNGVLVKTITDPYAIPRSPMYILANLAVGGSWGFIGMPNAGVGFPCTMEIDYIQVRQRLGAS